ncbi:TIGR04282 family arsenosugar biosynthesis glycosyltransferase [Lusitaniella coriacea]|uniref:TIGR04282 family arsenosugar biosynthesis glycosyltransferase n=1 Tax=Lusitaniella coriacea TaxID=1983105 RepID=UPI003CE8BBCD
MSETGQNCLIIFTRYPEPGKTKTRMITALGAEGAAQLQRQMTERAIAQAKKIPSDCTVEIHFSGGSQPLMEAWLGSDWKYRAQSPGDLGERMRAAFAGAFAAGMKRVAIIGIDCPDLTATLMDKAFKQLKANELVLGKAQDGGYYLIGLQRSIPALFENVPWGTSQVLQKTVEIALGLDLEIGYLPVLSDVDYPEDLPIWEKYTS